MDALSVGDVTRGGDGDDVAEANTEIFADDLIHLDFTIIVHLIISKDYSHGVAPPGNKRKGKG